MAGPSVSPEIDRLITLLARLPGLGPRSARRAALHLLKSPDKLMTPLANAMTTAADRISVCSVCGNVDSSNPCHICSAPGRDQTAICVVQDVSDLWAMERAGAFRGTYHVLGGTLSALDGVQPTILYFKHVLGVATEADEAPPTVWMPRMTNTMPTDDATAEKPFGITRYAPAQ
jgi:recombination protein RecR